MAIFNGKYCWDGTKRGEDEPIAWFPGSYNLKIFQCESPSKNVQHIKPILCIYSATGEGQSISANPEKFAKQICNDFALDIERVLWVEDLRTKLNRYEVVTFTRSGKMGNTIFYRTEKREALDGEVLMIQRKLAEEVMSA
ncbi:MAG: hypothetical protein WBB19_09690 [Desulforhopalus sp.]